MILCLAAHPGRYSDDCNVKAEACSHCGTSLVCLGGRTLRQSPAFRKVLCRSDDKRWFTACPTCKPEQLYDDQGIALPFLAPNGAMHTAKDTSAAVSLALAEFRFSRNALESGLQLANRDDDRPEARTSTAAVEAMAQQYRQAPSTSAALRLSNAICHWGGGGRVFGNLKMHHAGHLGDVMHRWMQAALTAASHEEALAPASPQHPAGLPHGLGISFGSKHLRMLDPDRFAVLDAVLSEGLGFALNPKGYALFMRHLRDLHQQLTATGWPHSLARTESGVFVLVQQNVRVDSDQPATANTA